MKTILLLSLLNLLIFSGAFGQTSEASATPAQDVLPADTTALIDSAAVTDLAPANDSASQAFADMIDTTVVIPKLDLAGTR
ncbi:hypothetical protein, partial [Herbaspirillum sp.]|uniref:hypothetical protein n=1 Tax=Herbaspirillum sp. TaxID=1890675 RepID=UPI002588AA1B